MSLGSVNDDGGFAISYTIANMLVLGGYAEPRHRVRLQQILILPRMHQGESTSRFRKKVHYRRKFLRLFIQKRKEIFARAWEMSDNNEVRNRWVRLARMALEQQRKHSPSVEKARVSKTTSYKRESRTAIAQQEQSIIGQFINLNQFYKNAEHML